MDEDVVPTLMSFSAPRRAAMLARLNAPKAPLTSSSPFGLPGQPRKVVVSPEKDGKDGSSKSTSSRR